ncbi:MAG: chemotaxis protein CheB [Vicinamibacterales bacterium]|nr:chemotaxis protein CheB [Vicinamibacterales bacterium]
MTTRPTRRRTEPPAAATERAPEIPDAPDAPGVPIVGIGASAGGLAAFERFFSAMPADTGMAFVLVQHLAPDHKSLLSDLVRRYTSMTVFEVEDGMRVQPHCAYIIPPNRDMAVMNGVLHLLEPSAPRGLRLPIDFFFRSLAQDRHERAICVVLSGTGSDGTLGARAIKGAGGLVVAQAPDSCEYDGMPRSAIATGLVDLVLPPADMPAQILAFAARQLDWPSRAETPATPDAGAALKKILLLLRNQTGHDFSQYKQSTVLRRIERRMAVHQIEDLDRYTGFLRKAPAEGEALFGDLLIGVTSFFRDPEAFTALETEVIAHLFEGRSSDTPIRVWSAGCSTGEEAYSIAILLQERLQALKAHVKIQLFATDIDQRAIDTARAGVYPANIAADVSAERLARFFIQDQADGSYRVHKHLRDMLVFSQQDLIKDPPFSKLDLISCRNLLIYMGPDLQHKLIPLFHYALKPNGALFLGSSETVGEFGTLFAPLDRKWKIFRRKAGDTSIGRLATGRVLPPVVRARGPRAVSPRVDSAARLRELTEQALLKQGHVAALVDAQGTLLYLHGRGGQYFEIVPGEAGMNIVKMAREGLRRDLAAAFHRAVATAALVRQEGVRVQVNGEARSVTVTVRPADAGTGVEAGREAGAFVVILEDAPAPPAARAVTDAADAPPGPDGEASPHVAALMQELRDKEEYLQATNEELETSNEELTSSNEEMQSVNEELQSANEELETSKEELQSVNEELATVNAELQTTVADLSRANNDLNNLLAGTGMGTVFVDHQLRIQRFTPAITQVINLIQADVGRPVGHILSNLVGYDTFVADIQAVLDSLTPREIEVQAQSGAWFLMRIRPYRTLDNVIEGAVITFTEITDVKRAQLALRDSEAIRRLAVVVRDANDAILVLGLDGRILAWNPAATRAYGWTEAEALTMNIHALVPDGQGDVTLARLREAALSDVLAPFRARRRTSSGHVLDVWLTAAALMDETGAPYAISTTERRLEEAAP